MKYFTLIFALFFLASLSDAVAGSRISLTDLRKMNELKNNEIKLVMPAVHKLLTEFEFTKKDEKLNRIEALEYLELAYKALNADETGQSEDYFYNAYNTAPKLFEKALKELAKNHPHKAAVLRFSLKQSRRLIQHGNDPRK